MTDSAINPININAEFPYPGVDNDSQVFRDNFAIIKSGLTSAKSELADLLTHAARKDDPVNNLNGNVLSNAVFKQTAEYRHEITGLQTSNFDVDYANGIYQTVQIGADLTINLVNFPRDTTDTKKVGKLKLHMAADSITRKVQFTATNAVIKYNENFPFVDSFKLSIAGSTTKEPTIVDAWQVNDGTSTPTIYLKYDGRYKYRTTPPPTPTTYRDNAGSIQNVASTAATTDDTTPGIIIGTNLASTPVLYINDVVTASTYNATAGTLTPTTSLANGTYDFKYSLIDQSGNEGSASSALTISIDSTAPTTPSNAPASYVDNVGTILNSSSVAATTDDTTPGINVGVGITDTLKLYGNGVWIPATYNSASGTLTPNNQLSEGTYAFTYTLTNTIGAESSQSPAITITIDTTAPTTNTPLTYADNVGTIQNANSTATRTDDPTPGINIGADLVDTPSLYIDGILTASSYNASTGTLTPTSPLSDGSYNVAYKLTDASGNTSSISPALNIIVDATAPTAVTITLTHDTGVSSSDGVTTNGQITVSGLESGATWEYSSDNGSNWATGTGTTFTLSTGSYPTGVVKVRQTDAVGNSSITSTSSNLVVDTTAPTITTVTPSWGSELDSTESSSNGTITIATSGVENGQTITVTLNSVQYTGTIAGNSATVTIPTADLSALTSGNSYTISVSVSDLAGNSTTNAGTSFSVNLTPAIGQPLGGGYYAGNIVDGGVTYKLIVAPKASGANGGATLTWGPQGDGPVHTQTLTNGPLASEALNINLYPAAYYCKGLNIGGFTDWYLPARDELEILYRNFKPGTTANATGTRAVSGFGGDGLTNGTNANSSPTGASYTSGSPAQTGVAVFQSGGTEAFVALGWYWSSTEVDSTYSWRQEFFTGAQLPNQKISYANVRAVRRVPL
jgi:hypothetical protein